MSDLRLENLAARVLIVVGVFNAASAFGGGAPLIVRSDGTAMGMPLSLLDGTPFSSFLWPGIVLFVVVGGMQTLAVIAQLRRSRWAAPTAAVAGFGLAIWIFVEVLLLGGFTVLYVLYFGTALLQLAALFVTLGLLSHIRARPRV
ncbi:hypothetical protein [Gryllotalpicola protaetiae]|uniref:Uncharacterized protein n=1 Tax=Gryllotalpicola protaetiae TaxID=2419771 RepID=A0A387BLD3_9MICO|nr:hypothetical protein [Gryllotalpicola protaetiae]AYG02884.1 hypothetical protein D7I44_04670 [Gryllotalpicola protaetiae]